MGVTLVTVTFVTVARVFVAGTPPKPAHNMRPVAWRALAGERGRMRVSDVAQLVGMVAVVAVVVVSVARGRHPDRRDVHVVRGARRTTLVSTTTDGAGDEVRVLRAGGALQSATYLDGRRMEPAFAYYRTLMGVLDLLPWMADLLVIGGGGFALPKAVAATRPGVRTTVVELDRAVVAAARRWFFLDEACELAAAGAGELRVTCEDGRAVLDAAAASGERCDAIVLDAFDGGRPVDSLATVEAARVAHALLGGTGVLLANVAPEDGSASFLRSYVAALVDEFQAVWLLPCEDEAWGHVQNVIVVASDAFLDLPEAVPFGEDFLGEPLRDADL